MNHGSGAKRWSKRARIDVRIREGEGGKDVFEGADINRSERQQGPKSSVPVASKAEERSLICLHCAIGFLRRDKSRRPRTKLDGPQDIHDFLSAIVSSQPLGVANRAAGHTKNF